MCRISSPAVSRGLGHKVRSTIEYKVEARGELEETPTLSFSIREFKEEEEERKKDKEAPFPEMNNWQLKNSGRLSNYGSSIISHQNKLPTSINTTTRREQRRLKSLNASSFSYSASHAVKVLF